ncbi:MAG: bifunctional glutamate--cysteine ligase GshA/glutathione synthetase GshB [Cellulosilyticaceae bacterium]
MLQHIKDLFTPEELLKGQFGIEREGLRCNDRGRLSRQMHPRAFGEKLGNPYITTDFSESQVELITPAFETLEETYKFLEALYDILAMEIGKEYLWPQSMPCVIPEDKKIPIARFCKCPSGQKARVYRKKLFRKYGGKKQLVSGIHYNFSFSNKFVKKLYDHTEKNVDEQAFKDEVYLKLARNYLRYRWLLIYLLGSTGIIHETYVGECVNKLESVGEDSFSNEGALSYRNGECGYKNKVDLYPNYNSVEEYVRSLKAFIEEGLIESPKELYSQIRLKAKDNEALLESLEKEGIHYLEYRSIDINPFDKAGISLEDLYVVHLFNLFLLIKEESDYENWQEEALENQRLIARFGQKDILLKQGGKMIAKEQWAVEILEEIKVINTELRLGKEVLIEKMLEKVKDYQLTYAYKLVEKVREEGYVEANLDLAKTYKESAYKNRFKLVGYEDMELSTQLLMKEAIKRGISVEIIDRSENFICLKKYGKVEYIKQATKTSKDNYVTVLMMENKGVTKNVLGRNQIKVPGGREFDKLEEAVSELDLFTYKPVVIKPKSTNFGVGISIFPEGTKKENLIEALKIAFAHDKTVLIEEFIKGKEYRFLVIDNKVVGVLHRVPANVLGDGVKSISELVAIKNQNPLRGKGYRTPLEKIELDDSAKLFLRQNGLDINYRPAEGEKIYLRENSNISTGGDSIDYTEVVASVFNQLAIQAAESIGAKICGVDMMIANCENEDSEYAIIELNFNPAIHIHCYPYEGNERNIAKEILKLLGFINL